MNSGTAHTATETVNTTVVTLTSDPVTEGSPLHTIFASISNAPISEPLVINVSNGATITFAVGATTATSTPFTIPITTHGEPGSATDLHTSITISGSVYSGGTEFENLQINSGSIVIIDSTPDAFVPDSLLVANVAGSSLSGSLNITSFGADGAATNNSTVISSVSYFGSDYSVDGDPTNMTSNGNVVSLSGFGTEVITATAAGSTVFTMTLDPSSGNYIYNLVGTLDDGASKAPVNIGGLTNSSEDYKSLSDVSGTGKGILFSAFNSDAAIGNVTQTTVNPSSASGGAIGAGAQSMREGSTLALDFVTNPTSGSSYSYDDHYTVNNFEFEITQAQIRGSASFSISIMNMDNYVSADFNDLLTTQTSSTSVITSLILTTANDVFEITTDGTYDGVKISGIDSSSVEVQGYNVGDTFEVISNEGFNRLELSGVDDGDGKGDTFDIGNLGYLNWDQGATQGLVFDVDIADNDGDVVSSSISVNVVPEGLDSIIISGDEDDILYGGSGDDLLTGGSGSDVFYWDAIDNGASDTINDFSSSEGDVLDLSDILQSTDTSSLDGMLNFALIGNDTVITVTKDNESQSITLKNVDLVTGATDDQAIIQGLLDSGSLDSL